MWKARWDKTHANCHQVGPPPTRQSTSTWMFIEIIISHEVILHDTLFPMGPFETHTPPIASKAPALAIEGNAKLRDGWKWVGKHLTENRPGVISLWYFEIQAFSLYFLLPLHCHFKIMSSAIFWFKWLWIWGDFCLLALLF